MPPCAHTECERFTGTSEIRSTGTFASQSLMTVISPASPPPTTITRLTLPPSLRIVLFAAMLGPMLRLVGRSGGRADAGGMGGLPPHRRRGVGHVDAAARAAGGVAQAGDA